MWCTPVPKFRRNGYSAAKRHPRQPMPSVAKRPPESPILLSPFPTQYDVFRRCNMPDPLRCHPPFTGSSILEEPRDFTQDSDISESEQATYEAYSAVFHASSDSNKQITEEDNPDDSSDSGSLLLASSSASSSSSHLPPLPSSSSSSSSLSRLPLLHSSSSSSSSSHLPLLLSSSPSSSSSQLPLLASSSSSSSSITLSSPSTLHPHYLSPTGLSILSRIRTHLCLPLDLPPSHLIVHLIRRWERARLALAQKNAELAEKANALDWSGVEEEEAVEFLDWDERDVLYTWAEAQRDMENRRLCPLFGAWGYT